MNAMPKRANPAFWVDGSTVRALVLERKMGKVPDGAVLEFPPVLDGAQPARKAIAIPTIGGVLKFERVISILAIATLALVLAGVSAGATLAGISTRDSQVAVQEIKSRISIMERDLELAKKYPPQVQESSIKNSVPIDKNSDVIWVPVSGNR